jgi:hypothetical protein
MGEDRLFYAAAHLVLTPEQLARVKAKMRDIGAKVDEEQAPRYRSNVQINRYCEPTETVRSLPESGNTGIIKTIKKAV